MTKTEAERLKKRIRNLRWESQYVFDGGYQEGWRDFRDKVVKLIEKESERDEQAPQEEA